MSIQKLTQNEINEVAGAGLLGNSIQAGANIVSGFLNLASPVGKAISLIPGVGIAHYIGDALIQGATDRAYNIGTALGGNLSQTKMHFAQELADNTYSPLGIFKYLAKR